MTGSFSAGMLARLTLALAATAVLLAIPMPASSDTGDELPDIGSPSDAILSRKLEAQIGR